MVFAQDRTIKLARFVGGDADGTTFQIQKISGRFPLFVYRWKIIPLWEAAALQINDAIAWRPPEEVYEYVGNGTYEYRRTVHYKPE